MLLHFPASFYNRFKSKAPFQISDNVHGLLISNKFPDIKNEKFKESIPLWYCAKIFTCTKLCKILARKNKLFGLNHLENSTKATTRIIVTLSSVLNALERSSTFIRIQKQGKW